MRESLGKCGLSKALGGRGIAVVKLSYHSMLQLCASHDTIGYSDVIRNKVANVPACKVVQATYHM